MVSMFFYLQVYHKYINNHDITHAKEKREICYTLFIKIVHKPTGVAKGAQRGHDPPPMLIGS